jgi:K+-transporting ATPase KdpF subunit
LAFARRRLRCWTGCEATMTDLILGGGVAACVFVYLCAALLRPDLF